MTASNTISQEAERLAALVKAEQAEQAPARREVPVSRRTGPGRRGEPPGADSATGDSGAEVTLGLPDKRQRAAAWLADIRNPHSDLSAVTDVTIYGDEGE